MARIKNGILGGFSGKVGNVIGFHLNGNDYMKGKSKERTTPPTKGEQANWDKFAYVQKWLTPLTEFFRVGFKDYNPKYQGFLAAKSYNFKNAVIGSWPNFQMDPAKALVSHGDMSQAPWAVATAERKDYVTFDWEKAHDFCHDDRAMLVAYDMTGYEACFNTASEKANSGSARLKLEESMRGKQLDIYLAFVSEDRKRRSKSQYLGVVTAL